MSKVTRRSENNRNRQNKLKSEKENTASTKNLQIEVIDIDKEKPKSARKKTPTRRKSKCNSPNNPVDQEKRDSTSENSNVVVTTPKVDLETFYRNQGVSLSYVRRLNRNYIRHDGPLGEARGLLYWDSFSPPPGYSDQDLPALDSSQPKDTSSLSPAILNAAEFHTKSNGFVYQTTKSESDIHDLIRRLTKPRCYLEKPGKLNEDSTTGNSDTFKREGSIVCDADGSFPDDGEDSEYLRCTQAIESEYQINRSAVRKNNNIQVSTIRDSPILFEADSIIASTPTSMESYIIRKKARRSILDTPRSGKHTSNNISTLESLETSPIVCSQASVSNCKSSTKRNSICRRSLFSTETSSKSTSTSGGFPSDAPAIGQFEDDGADELFSQIKMPDDEDGTPTVKPTAVTACSKGSPMNISEKSTVLINESDGSLGSSILSKIEKWEEAVLNKDNPKVQQTQPNSAFSAPGTNTKRSVPPPPKAVMGMKRGPHSTYLKR